MLGWLLFADGLAPGLIAGIAVGRLGGLIQVGRLRGQIAYGNGVGLPAWLIAVLDVCLAAGLMAGLTGVRLRGRLAGGHGVGLRAGLSAGLAFVLLMHLLQSKEVLTETPSLVQE